MCVCVYICVESQRHCGGVAGVSVRHKNKTTTKKKKMGEEKVFVYMVGVRI